MPTGRSSIREKIVGHNDLEDSLDYMRFFMHLLFVLKLRTLALNPGYSDSLRAFANAYDYAKYNGADYD